MTEPLWSDERIDQRTTEISKELYDNALHPASGATNNVAALKQLTREMRDSYEQRISDLHEEYEGRHYKTCMYYVKFIDQIGNETENLRRENDRLRALLPSAATRNALRRAMVDAGWSHNDNAHVWAWLERMEANDE